jgi:Cu-Zn family superoxide dismutase
MRITRKTIGIGAALTLGIGGVALATMPSASGASQSVTARMIDQNGNPAGQITFTINSAKTKVHAVAQFPREFEGFHGFHVHAKGVCDPKAVDDKGVPTPFFTAGGHFSITVQGHRSHSGDLPSLMVLGDGTADMTFNTDRFSVGQLLDSDGSAVMIHVGPDNFANIPTRYVSSAAPQGGPDAATHGTGDAGGRLACGVVK